MPVWGGICDVGYINFFDGSSEDYKWKRSGGEIIVEKNAPLFLGDKITVLSQKVEIELVVNGKTISVTSEKPYSVQSHSSLQTFTQSACKLFKKEVLGESSRHDSVATSQQWGTLSIPLLLGKDSFPSELEEVSAEYVYFTWKGGKAPYKVKVYEDGAYNNNTGNIKVICEDTENCSKITVVPLTKELFKDLGFIQHNVAYQVRITDSMNNYVKLEGGKSHHIFTKKEVENGKYYLVVAGGKAPYTITIRNDANCWRNKVCTDKGEVVCTNIIQFALKAQDLKLEQNQTYYFKVTDDRGETKQKRFKVVPKKHQIKNFNDVMELAKQGKKELLEAYQHVVKINCLEPNNEFAELLKQRLELGRTLEE